MAKVVRVVINHHFLPVKFDSFAKGTIVPFDIYIKRYNDFVIVIEAGTLLDEVLYSKLSQHLNIYVSKDDSKRLKKYCSLHKTIDFGDQKKDPINAVLGMKETLSTIHETQEKLFFVYSTVLDLMKSIFESSNETLPLEAISSCVHEIATLLQTKENVFPLVLKIFPNEYSTYHHSTNVACFAAIIGNNIQLKHQELVELTFAALLHDIGKLRIDDTILEKTSYLEDDEYESVKLHSQLGYEILNQNHIDNETILKAVRYHHERLDGSGYPDRLRGKIIPRNARIIAVCDVFDALTTNRTFRDYYTSFEALLLMKREMHTQLDEKFVDMFIQLHR